MSTAIYEGAKSKYWTNDVIMCQGSNYSRINNPTQNKSEGLTNNRLAKTYNPNVANNDTTIFLKIGFVKNVPKVNVPFSVAIA